MKPDKLTVYNLFEQARRYLVPLYQRPYVWERDADLVPLWQDIRGRAEAAVERMNRNAAFVQPHFLGAIVTRSIPVYGLQVQSLDVIDGQQRLTTLQLFIAAVRDVVAADESVGLDREFSALTVNSGTVADELERLKVLPTNADRAAFRTVMNARSAKVVKGFRDAHRKQWNGTNRIAEAYLYFHDAVHAWLYDTDSERPSRGQHPRERGIAMFEALRNHLQFIVIGLEDEDDPQAIFETLNARGQPLLASDLVRNFVFTQANTRGEDADNLYERYWRDFDDVGRSPFWRVPVQFGREKRERIVLFLFHFLSSRLAIDFGASHLYDTFKRWWVGPDGPASVEEGLQTLRLYSDAYRRIVEAEPASRFGTFLNRLSTLETTSFHPTLLHVMVDRGLGRDDLDRVGAYLESYLVRRLVAGLTTKNLNRVALSLLQTLKGSADVTPDTVVDALSEGDGDSVRWPDNREFGREWLARPVYRKLRRATTGMILRALELQLTTRFHEQIHIDGSLSIEHVMPREWRKHWQSPPAESGTDEEGAEDRRDRLLNTFGNLTILTQPLNSKLSNSEYPRKRTQIRQSLLVLNHYFYKAETWDESQILRRGEELLSVARTIWPIPDGLTHEPTGSGTSNAEVDTSDMSDDVGRTDYNQEQLYEDVAYQVRERGVEHLGGVKVVARRFVALNMRGWPKTLHYEFRRNLEEPGVKPTIGIDLEGPKRLKNRNEITQVLKDLTGPLKDLFPGNAVVWDDSSFDVRRTLSIELDASYLDPKVIADGLQRLIERTWKPLDEAVRGRSELDP